MATVRETDRRLSPAVARLDIQDVAESTLAACGHVRAPSLLCEEILHSILAERLRSDVKRF